MELITLTGGSLATNSYLLVNDGYAIAFDFVPEKIEKYLKDKSLILESIFITHVHFDHIEGLGRFIKQNVKIKIYGNNNAINGINSPASTLSLYSPAVDKEVQIDTSNAVILKDDESLDWRGIKIRHIETPGHSICSSAYIIGDGEQVITGDTVFYLSVGRSDFPGGDHKKLISSIDKLFSRIDNNSRLYPGHGPSTTVGFEKENNPYLS